MSGAGHGGRCWERSAPSPFHTPAVDWKHVPGSAAETGSPPTSFSNAIAWPPSLGRDPAGFSFPSWQSSASASHF